MVGFGAFDIASFLVAIAIAFVLVTLWILKSDYNRNAFKSEIQKLKTKIEDSEREKYLLAEEVDTLKGGSEFAPASGAAAIAGEKSEGSEKLVKTIIAKNENLEADNAKLRAELDELKGSMEEIYKALSEQ
jgi:cell division protein FtsB